jgi:hypothetical protein
MHHMLNLLLWWGVLLLGFRSTWVLTEFQSSIQVTTSVAADIFKVHADVGLSHPKLPQIQMFLSLS